MTEYEAGLMFVEYINGGRYSWSHLLRKKYW